MVHERIHRVLTATCLVAWVGCSDPKEATKANFAAALDQELAHDRECLHFKLPAEYAAKSTNRDQDHGLLDALVTQGLVSKRDAMKKDWRGELQPQHVYELTPEGEKFVPKDRVLGQHDLSGTYLCYGTGKVAEVTNFSAPTSLLGTTVSEVHFAYKVHDVAAWANQPDLLQVKAVASAVNGEPITKRAMLMLTNDGWQTEDAFRRGSRASAR